MFETQIRTHDPMQAEERQIEIYREAVGETIRLRHLNYI